MNNYIFQPMIDVHFCNNYFSNDYDFNYFSINIYKKLFKYSI